MLKCAPGLILEGLLEALTHSLQHLEAPTISNSLPFKLNNCRTSRKIDVSNMNYSYTLISYDDLTFDHSEIVVKYL